VSVPDEMTALRGSVAMSRLDHVSHLRLRGTGVYEALDRFCTSALHLRDGQMLHTLLLDEDARCLADAYLCSDDEEFVLLAEGPSSEYLVDHLRDGGIEVEERSDTHAIVSLDGPYAWELLGRVVDPGAIGLPYLTFYHYGAWLCYRAGKTGEYGYGIIVPRDDVADLEERLLNEGSDLDVCPVGLDALDQGALENFFFNIRREGREPVTPIELQLQWRVSYRKDFVGSDALKRRKREGPRERLTCLLAGNRIATGSEVRLEGSVVGRVVNAGYSHVRGDWVALAMLDITWAHSGIDRFTALGDGAPVSLRSVSPPVLNNRSLMVSPQLHSYSTRHEYAAPSIVRH
jgi:glycine cleavage system aminomethyltransferase T